MQALRRPLASLTACLAAVLLGASSPAAAAEAAAQSVSLPPSVVLVLKLVTRDFVRPTTGLVISADGKVVVPAGFVEQGDEIVVLDGGTDIARNGRPARTIRRSVAEGLAVLQVSGLRRPPAALAETGAAAGAPLFFAAFPPAEKIAQGAAPLWQAVTLTAGGVRDATVPAAGTPLPAVSGFLFDRCGHVAAMVLAHEAGPGDASGKTRQLDAEKFKRVLADMQISFTQAVCGQAVPTQPQADGAAPPPPEQHKIELTGVTRKSPAPEDSGPKGTAATPADEAKSGAGAETPPTPAVTMTAQPPPSAGDTKRRWLLLLLIPLLAVLLWLGGRKRGAAGATSAVSAEPATAELDTSPAIGTQHPQDAAAAVIPEPDSLPADRDGLLLLEGSTAGGVPLRAYCTFGAGPVDIVIGRGADGLDLRSAAVSRAHARIAGPPGALTLTDLGSSNGTFINGIPCLHGETMYLSANDELRIGDVSARLRVRCRDGADE